jgi:hypothetical protein
MRVRGATWWPHTPAWMSRRSSRPWGMGTHRSKMPDEAHLYSSPSTRVNDLAILAMRLALDRSERSSLRSIQAMYLAHQSSSRGGGGLCVHGLGLVCAIPLEQGEHKHLVRGVLVEDHVWFEDRWMDTSLCDE